MNTSSRNAPRAPEAFALSPGGDPIAPDVAIRNEEDFTAALDKAGEDAAALPEPRRSGLLSRLFWWALGLLASLFLVDAIWTLVLSLGTKSSLAGHIGLGLVVFLGIVGVAWLAREAFSVFRLRTIRRLRVDAEAIRAKPYDAAVRKLVVSLSAFYADDPTTAAARAEIARSMTEVHDAPTRLDIAERALLGPKDRAARTRIAAAAQRVSVVTAVSPRALVDILFVLAQSIALIRQLSVIYGGRASGFALLRLASQIAGHLAITGGMAAADQFLSQVMGAGLASRLSAKLGEGVLNGILTARIGLAAVEACRPMPFHAEQPIFLSEVVNKAMTQ
ncbi:COG3768 Predicted membrane protein [Rhabdaerophilaceae bacterium]